MSARDITRILNNESNLKILDKLKEKPFYPRELAAEMGLTEPFIVRRLKAMEEHDIVEGRWETANNRKVKRYYLKDIKIEYGRCGLTVSSKDAPVKKSINMRNELIGRVAKLPVAALFVYGILFKVIPIILLMLIIAAWYAANMIAIYRKLNFNTHLLSLIMFGLILTLIPVMIADEFNIVSITSETAYIIIIFTLASLMFVMMYQGRFYQMEYESMIRDMKDLMADLEEAPVYVKIFYLPTVLKWKISEYFNFM